MVTERVITLPTEQTEGEIVKSHQLFSFINISQRGRMSGNTFSQICHKGSLESNALNITIRIHTNVHTQRLQKVKLSVFVCRLFHEDITHFPG